MYVYNIIYKEHTETFAFELFFPSERQCHPPNRIKKSSPHTPATKQAYLSTNNTPHAQRNKKNHQAGDAGRQMSIAARSAQKPAAPAAPAKPAAPPRPAGGSRAVASRQTAAARPSTSVCLCLCL